MLSRVEHEKSFITLGPEYNKAQIRVSSILLNNLNVCVLLAPEAAQSPKVYVTQRKNAASSKVTLAADFRWSEPESTNGILSSQNVFYWKSSEPHKVSSMALPASARHFILDDLQGNTTYFFQVCTFIISSPEPKAQR